MDYMKFGGLMQIWLGVLTVAIVVTLDFWWLWMLALVCLMVGCFFIPQPKQKLLEAQVCIAVPTAVCVCMCVCV